MAYDGLGQRLSMTGFADGQSLTTQYALDGSRVLSADADGYVTTYLYGLGPIGQLTDTWAYGLPDGSGTQRQLVDPQGEITLAASYTPWGDTLSVTGTGAFTYGYFGGVMDAATGLLYVGNGQYFDPATGRFLNRNLNPGSANPYVPWSGEPTGALIGPLVLLAMLYSRKKRRGKLDTIIILLALSMSLGVALSACGNTAKVKLTVTASAVPTATPTATVKVEGTTIVSNIPMASSTPSPMPTLSCDITALLTQTPTPMPSPMPDVQLDPFVRWYQGIRMTAADMVTLYEKYKEQVDGLTIEEFLGLMVYREMGAGALYYYNETAHDLLIHALAVQLWSGHSGFQFCQGSSTCFNGVFNWLIHYSESTWKQYIAVVINKKPVIWSDIIGGEVYAVNAANYIGYSALHNPCLRAYSDQVPYHWGNPPDEQLWWIEILRREQPEQGSQDNQIHYWEAGTGFVIYSVGQGRYWCNLALSKGIQPPKGQTANCYM